MAGLKGAADLGRDGRTATRRCPSYAASSASRPVTLYRYVGPQGQLREQGQKEEAFRNIEAPPGVASHASRRPSAPDRHHRRRGLRRPPWDRLPGVERLARTPSSASWSKTARRSWRTGHPPRTGAAASPFVDGTEAPTATSAWAWREAGRRGRCSSMGDEPAHFDGVTAGARRHLHGRPVRLPGHRDGWRWKPNAVVGTDCPVCAALRCVAAETAVAAQDVIQPRPSHPGPSAISIRGHQLAARRHRSTSHRCGASWSDMWRAIPTS